MNLRGSIYFSTPLPPNLLCLKCLSDPSPPEAGEGEESVTGSALDQISRRLPGADSSEQELILLRQYPNRWGILE